MSENHINPHSISSMKREETSSTPRGHGNDLKISVISVCYNESGNLEEMYRRVKKSLEGANLDFELIYVDNASVDNSRSLYEQLCQRDQRVKVIFMARNTRSSQTSFLAGLKLAQGDCAVLLDGDIQDPPELIPKMVERWQEGNEVIYGVRKKRQEGFLLKFCYKAFYRVFRKMAYLDIPLDAGDFSLVDRKVIDHITQFNERDFYLRGIRAYAGFRQVGLEYVREKRKEGKSNANWGSNFRWAKTLIVNFSFKPLEWISKLAFLVMLFAFVMIIVYLLAYFLYPEMSPRGVPTIVMLILFLGGIQLFALSIIAEYLAKIFVEVKGRPRYIVKEILNDNKTDPHTL